MGMLRLLLALAVVLAHSEEMAHENTTGGAYMIPGAQAVQIFFMISGFYMALILIGKYGVSEAGLRKFFLNRALRLYPTYYAVLAGTLGWQVFCLWSQHGHHLSGIGSALHEFGARHGPALTWFPNYTLVGMDVAYFFDAAPHGLALHAPVWLPVDNRYWLQHLSWVGQMWSVAVEMWFYLMAPSLVRGGQRRLLVVIALSLGLQLVVRHFVSGSAAYFFWPSEIYLFALGMLAYRRYVLRPGALDRLARYVWAILPLAWIWLTLMPLVGFHPSEWVLDASAIFLIPALFHLTQSWGWDRFIGNLSYPVYCVHLFVWELAKTAIGRLHLPFHLLGLFTAAGSVLAGLAIYLLVDHGIERVRRRIAPKKPRTVAQESQGETAQPSAAIGVRDRLKE
jgi:peptidoglycan/LPS O-acetylase OafA/YrhL